MNTKRLGLFILTFAAVFALMFIILNLFVFRVKLSFNIEPMYFITASLKKMPLIKIAISSAAGLIAGGVYLKLKNNQ